MGLAASVTYSGQNCDPASRPAIGGAWMGTGRIDGMERPPTELLAMLPESAKAAVEDWWNGLGDADRRKLATLWDERLETRFFSPQTDASGQHDDWNAVPRATGGRFIPRENTDDFDGYGETFLELLLDDPAIILAYEGEQRTFHIGGVTPLPTSRQ
jgi:hypothetical protein